MKALLLILSLHLFLSANELQWVDEQIEAIKPPRQSISKSKINSIKNPFIFLKKTIEKDKEKKALSSSSKRIKPNTSSSVSNSKISRKTTSFTLSAIINKSALINGQWYKLHKKVGKYTLSQVNRTSVLLTYKKKTLILSTQSRTKKLNFKNK